MNIPTNLRAGYQRFRDDRYAREKRHYRQIAEGKRQWLDWDSGTIGDLVPDANLAAPNSL